MGQEGTLTELEIFPWNDNFVTGIEAIDEQHRQLVALLNRLALHYANRSGEAALEAAFDELAAYADYHFRTEEAVWSEHLEADPSYRSHLATHHRFIGDVLDLKKNEEGKAVDEVIYGIVAFLSKWLAFHILESDKRMAKTIIAIQEGADAEAAKRIADEQMSGITKVLINTVLNMYENLSTSTLNLMREKALRRQAEEELSRSEERWQVILQGGSENVWDWDIAEQRASHSEEVPPLFEIVGSNTVKGTERTVHPADMERIRRDFRAHLEGGKELFTGKYRVLRDNGSWAWFMSRGKVVSRDAKGRALRIVGTHSDITERELGTKIFQNSSQAMLICDMNNKIISINPAFTEITGYTLEDVLGQNPRILSSKRNKKALYKEMWRSILKEGKWQGEIYNRRKNGEIFPELLMINTVRDEEGNIDHYFAIFDDITEKKRAYELIFEQANYDPLTKLPNRRMLYDRLQQEVKRSRRSRIPFAVIFFDLDHFKDINDTLGHDAGDLLLLEAARRITGHVRESDTVAHLGGDKFVVVAGEVKDISALEQMTQGLMDTLSRPFSGEGNSIHISASAGIALYPYDAEDASVLIKHAEQTMYLAKKSGRNRYGYFTPEMQAEARKRQTLLGDLHEALQAKQFEIFYQPIVDLTTGRIFKAEALLRWKHPIKGMVSPEAFIPLAEESGLIVEIGDWVYREATRQAKRWQERYDPSFQISINKSPVQFRADGVVEAWRGHLGEIGMPGKNSVIEITENLLMENESQVARILEQLREEGMEISLDDFGTGYSSLAYLQKFRIDYLKIDKSFVSNLGPESTLDSTLCEAIVTMAHKLDIKVIAEGVETPFQLELLSNIRCDFAQGYFFSRPVSAEVFEGLLEQGAFETV